MESLKLTSGEIVFPVFAGTLLFTLLAIFIIYFIVLYNKAQQRFNRERQQFKETLLQTEIEIKEQTLKNVSRELHDNIGHIASLVKINLNMMSKELRGPDQAKLEESLDLLKQLIADIKSLSVSLNSENITRLGLKEVIISTVGRINRTGSIKVDFIEQNTLPILEFGIELILYRMIQEMLSNTLQHAEASTVILTIDTTPRNLFLHYNDNGKGFNTEKIVQGSGLFNLIERCKLISAGISIESRPGLGTAIYISVPILT